MNQAREMQICPAWVIGPDEVERFGQEYAGNLRRSAPVLYEEDVVNAADLVADADVYFGNDAGMTHVAALAGVPTYTIFGPTDPRIWRPLGPRVRVVPFPSPRESTASWTGTLSAELRNLFGELRAGPTA